MATAGFSAVSALASTGSAYFDYKTMDAQEPIVVMPSMVTYTSAVQKRAADELDSLGDPCSAEAETNTKNCSALAKMMLDYVRMRDQIRSAKKE